MNWRKIILWSVAVVLFLVVGSVITGVLLLKYNHGFRGYLLAKVENAVYSSTGAHLHIRDFSVNLSSLSVDLHDLVVHGTEAPSQPPLFTADRLNADLTVDSVLQRKWHFQSITVDHPVIHVIVNKAGKNNLPKPKSSNSNSKTNLFDLGIRHFIVDRGAAYFNDRKTPLSANLHNLELTAAYHPAHENYEGHIGYDDGMLKYGSYAPVPHSLTAAFSLTPERLKVDRMTLDVGKSRMVLNATVRNYSSHPEIQANYDASLVTGEFAKMLKNASIPSGTVDLTGALHYQPQPNRPFLDSVSLWGMIKSPELYVNTPKVETAVRNLSAKYRVENGNAELQNLHGQVLNGTLNGTLTVRNIAGAAQGRLQASLQGASLDLLQKAANSSSLRQAHLVGNVNANVQASWKNSLKNLVAHANLGLQGRFGQNLATPISGVVHANYSAASQRLAVQNSYIRTPGAAINLNGNLSQLSQLKIRMHFNDLHQFETLIASFKAPSKSGTASVPLNLHGTASVTASVTGSLRNPQIRAQVVGTNVSLQGASWKRVHADVKVSRSQLQVTNGQLQSAGQGHLNFNLQAGLRNWSFSRSAPISLQLHGSQISVAEIEHMLNKSLPVSGTLTVNVSLHGSELAPAGHGDIVLTNAKVYGQTVNRLNVQFQGTGTQLTARLKMQTPAGTATAQGSYAPKAEAYQAELHAINIRLGKLDAVQAKGLPLTGGLNLNASGRGTLKSPEFLATLAIPELQVQKQTIQNAKLQVHVQNQVADIALASNVAQSYVKGGGSIGIKPPYIANIHLDSGRIAFAPLLALYAPAYASDLTGQTELHAWLKGPIQDKSRLEAHLQIPVLTAKYKQLQLAAVKPMQVDYRNNVAVLQPTAIQGTDTSMQMQARIPINNLKAASFLAKGTVDLRIAELVQPTLQSTGQIQFDIDSRQFAAENLNGQIRIVNATIHTPTAPVGLDHANGVISLTNNQLKIASFQAGVGGGTVTATGGVTYRPALQFNVAMAAKDVRIRYPEGLRTVLNANLNMTGKPAAALLGGQVRIQNVSFTPAFDLSTFVGQFGNAGGAPSPNGGFTQNVKLNVGLQSASQMELRSSQLSVSGNANLRVEGTLAAPVVLGRATLNSGEMFLAGNRYTIQNGTVDFLNPVRTEPVVNLQVRTTIDQYDIAMNVEGPIERLHTEYTSTPSLPPVDIINLIATGKTTEAAGATPSPGFTSGAESLIAQGIASQVSGRIAKVAGLSHLSIDPALGGNGQNPGARIAIQQRVTGNLFITFATDVTSTQRQAIEMQYQFNRRWSMSGVRDQNGGFGADVHYKKDF